jgi:mannose-1-phosphate guanylyltransferase
VRFALILAGGSGTRLWPLSRGREPKQLIPFVKGRSLLEISLGRLEGLVDRDRRYICAGESYRERIQGTAGGIDAEQYIGEPVGRDTLAALALSSAVISLRDPQATIGVFTADHIIEPVDRFLSIVGAGFDIVEAHPDTLLTFGITPTRAATGYGYLELGGSFEDGDITGGARAVTRFREKPDAETAARYLSAGSDRYLWNSGMFLWKASTFLACVERYHPDLAAGIARISAAWKTRDRSRVLAAVYPSLKRISVDFGVMESASVDPSVRVAALPMPLEWKDIGSWPTFAEICSHDEAGNALAGGRQVLVDCRGTLVASTDPEHLVAGIGCEDLIVVHTANVTLVCRRDRAEGIKTLQQRVAHELGDQYI